MIIFIHPFRAHRLDETDEEPGVELPGLEEADEGSEVELPGLKYVKFLYGEYMIN
jgi:hypothetical protein